MTTTPPTTLADFLLARIAEDTSLAMEQEGTGWSSLTLHPDPYGRIGYEARAIGPSVIVADWDGPPPRAGYHPFSELVARFADPDRILAECDAREKIVRRHMAWSADDPCSECRIGLPTPCPTARLLALPYADHPDYLPEWRP